MTLPVSVSHAKKITVEVVSAADMNPKYLSCVPLFISSWKIISQISQFNFSPRVILVADVIPAELCQFSSYIDLSSPLDFNTAFSAQNIRLFMGGTSEADVVLTSDIDMLPASPRIFELGVQTALDKNAFVILRDVLDSDEYPICYNLASPKIWQGLFGPNESVPDAKTFLTSIANEYDPDNLYSGVHGGSGWNIDQRNLFDNLQRRQRYIKIEKFTDSETQHRRLDRIHHRFPMNWIVVLLVPFGFFSDYHVHHPISRNFRFVRFYLFTLKLQRKLRRLRASRHIW